MLFYIYKGLGHSLNLIPALPFHFQIFMEHSDSTQIAAEDSNSSLHFYIRIEQLLEKLH